MTNQKKVWNMHKITAIVILLVALALAFSLYLELDNPATNQPKSLERSISNYISYHGSDVQAKIVQIERHEKYLITTFTDEKYPSLMGIAMFQRGNDGFWHPIGVSYKNGLSVETYQYHYDERYDYNETENTYYQRSKTKTIIYGINADPQISSIRGIKNIEEITYEQDVNEPRISNVKEVNNYQEILYEQSITESNFITYYSNEDYFEENQIDEWRMIDSDGNDITRKLEMEMDDSGPYGSLFSGGPRLQSGGLNFLILLFAYILAGTIWTKNPNEIKYLKQNSEREEIKSIGLRDKFKNLNKKKKTAIYIVIITLAIVFVFYFASYSTFDSENGLTKSIERYTKDDNVTLLKTETEGRYLIALYTTEKPNYKGIVTFERGLNGLWKPIEYDSKTDICITFFWVKLGNDYKVAVIGADCDPRAVSYEYLHKYEYWNGEEWEAEKPPVVIYGNDISESNFIHIYNTSNRYAFVPQIYDSAGNDIEPELREKFWDGEHTFEGDDMRMSQTNTKSIFAIIVIGFFLAWMYWISIPKEEE